MSRCARPALGALILAAASLPACNPPAAERLPRLASPPTGTLYQGVYPGGPSGAEDDVTLADVQSYVDAVGQEVAWVYFSHNWFKSRAFPQATAEMIRDDGAVPFIRLMLRSAAEQNVAEPLFTLDAIIAGEFDADLDAWGAAARQFGTPLPVEWGTECNGEWFPWNGAWNGAGATDDFGDPDTPDGPERFVAAYRHIVERIRAAGATNVAFVWHVNDGDVPDESWNRLEQYYPGDGYVDWVAVSVYGPQTPLSDEAPEFTASLDAVYPRLAALSADKPIIVAEFGCTAGNPLVAPDEWAEDALSNLWAGRWPRIIGFSWWNESWQNDEDPAHDTTMRVQDVAELAAAFRGQLAAHAEQLAVTPVLEEESH